MSIPRASSSTLIVLLLITTLSTSGCLESSDDESQEEEPQETSGNLTLQVAFPNLSFERPVALVHAGDDRLFVVEQAGRIYVFDNDPLVENKTLFLDITDNVSNAGNEEGLLGLAFHPDYLENGHFFLDYSASEPRRSVLSRFSVNQSDHDRADPGSEKVFLEVDQPYSNHNGGHLAFGPDGFLYWALGDGGSSGDPEGHGQNRSTLLGSILRLDVDKAGNGTAYSIPADNPYAGNEEGFREEIFAYGLRNPWRFSFDNLTGDLWAADVGQNRYEEVNLVVKGGNYGWRVMEGSHCYDPGTGCDQSGLERPVWVYDHKVGYSITGGHVYRGQALSELQGAYVYGDFGTGRIWALKLVEGEYVNEGLFSSNLNIASFGVDLNNVLYVVAFDEKQLYAVKSAD